MVGIWARASTPCTSSAAVAPRSQRRRRGGRVARWAGRGCGGLVAALHALEGRLVADGAPAIHGAAVRSGTLSGELLVGLVDDALGAAEGPCWRGEARRALGDAQAASPLVRLAHAQLAWSEPAVALEALGPMGEVPSRAAGASLARCRGELLLRLERLLRRAPADAALRNRWLLRAQAPGAVAPDDLRGYLQQLAAAPEPASDPPGELGGAPSGR
jgi:hypothetical protein